jgi:hypothetical protein
VVLLGSHGLWNWLALDKINHTTNELEQYLKDEVDDRAPEVAAQNPAQPL